MGISKRLGNIQALDSVEFSIGRGEIVALLGRNGAGKTTLISIIAGILAPDEGNVRVLGLDVRAQPMAVRGIVGFAPQDLAIYPPLSVRQNLRFFGRMNGGRAGRRRLDEHIEQITAALGLNMLLDRTADGLSGGEKRRLHTAIALLNEPRLVLLDEPTAGADVQARTALLDVVRDLAENGTAVCYCTHYLSEVEAMGARVIIMDSGRIIMDGSVESIIDRAGGSVLELEFEEALPRISAGGIRVDGNRLRMTTTSPATGLADLLKLLNGKIDSLRSIEILRPSLETVYIQLTGRRFDSSLPGSGEVP